jgi:type I restriction enzyme S subunit
LCGDCARIASEGTTNRVLSRKTVLPRSAGSGFLPLSEQQAIVARLDALAEKTREVEAHLDAVERDAEHLLALRFRDVITDAPLRPMAEVAPAVRRTVDIDISQSYREVGAALSARDFRQTDFRWREATWQKPVWIKSGDLVLSNIKAWEGAIASLPRCNDWMYRLAPLHHLRSRFWH